MEDDDGAIPGVAKLADDQEIMKHKKLEKRRRKRLNWIINNLPTKFR